MIKTICIVGADEGDVVISKGNSPDVVFLIQMAPYSGSLATVLGEGLRLK